MYQRSQKVKRTVENPKAFFYDTSMAFSVLPNAHAHLVNEPNPSPHAHDYDLLSLSMLDSVS